MTYSELVELSGELVVVYKRLYLVDFKHDQIQGVTKTSGYTKTLGLTKTLACTRRKKKNEIDSAHCFQYISWNRDQEANSSGSI